MAYLDASDAPHEAPSQPATVRRGGTQGCHARGYGGDWQVVGHNSAHEELPDRTYQIHYVVLASGFLPVRGIDISRRERPED